MAKRYDRLAGTARDVPAEILSGAGLRYVGQRFYGSKDLPLFQNTVGAPRFQSPSKGVSALRGALTPGLSQDDAQQIIGFLNAKCKHVKVNAGDLNYEGRFFSVRWSTGALKALHDVPEAAQRMQIVVANQSYISSKMNANLTSRLLPMLLEIIKDVAEEIMNEMIYEAGPVQVVSYKTTGRGGKIEEHESDAGDLWPEYIPSGNLMKAVLNGITLNGLDISFNIDEGLAPYWMWVDKGHRVFINGVETGTWVSARPFMERIYAAIDNLMKTVILGDMAAHFQRVAHAIGEWALWGGEKTTQTLQGDYSVKNYPKGGYTPAFFKRVGVA